MELAKRDGIQVLPYELIELIMMELSIDFLEELFIWSTKHNSLLSPHIKYVIQKKQKPTRKYIFKVYTEISRIVTMNHYINTILHFHTLKLIDRTKKEDIIYKNVLLQKITNPRDKTKFKNLTDSLGKYCE